MLHFGILNNSKVLHIIDVNNKNICSNKLMNKVIMYNDLNNKYKLCKLCSNRFIKKITINNIIFYKLYNLLYESIDDICLKREYAEILSNGDLDIKNLNITVNYIKINKVYYYLVNNVDLYNGNDLEIFNNDFSKKIGKLLGPKIAIIRKEMMIIDNIKYNLWNL